MIECKNVAKEFYSGFWGQYCYTALQAVSLEIMEGHTYALCGLSGSGKSTLGRILLGLLKPSCGDICYDGVSLENILLSKKRRKNFRRQHQIIFQNPQATLYPDFTIHRLLEEPYQIHHESMGKPNWGWIELCMDKVKLSLDLLDRYPFQLSGGQLQRICIARVLLMKPSFLVLDEPTAMLDPTAQVEMMRLLKKLQKTEKLTYFFISHDLNLVRYMADDVGIIYQGKILEQGAAATVLTQPRERFTQQFIREFDSF